MGVHAAGVIMSSEPIIDHVPIWVAAHRRRRPSRSGTTRSCESLGLLKMDFLGLRNLTIMDDAVKMVKANKGIDLELLALPLDDPKTYAAARPRRHAGRLPVRRRPDALPAAP